MPVTRHLLLRPSLLSDAAELHRFLGDPEVMALTHRDADLAATEARIAAYEARRVSDGFAPWTAILRGSGQIVGWGGLYVDPADPDWGPEVGYYFAAEVWGRGLAGELVAEALREADQTHRLAQVTGFAHADNAASRRVLTRAGFVEVGDVPEMGRIQYRRTRPASPEVFASRRSRH
ncbi:GNAT family N-acetyltransferase [Frigidibacter sp. ROC022]|uniref:GNAT family N-acetyltransferase n=1 Tax=Frigidibacter sp. ROC022 TaxID=2971796 RepID=UPI00215A45D5|nr:GNAT family N-acetyltransferase [Frigidibacter sp. ROC022]MCR8723596.1 GNAT family N-acetyltransferase [Frigidibacter sp. ROC022]